jgi:putative pre-16S rRNA nuclease
MLRVPIEKNLPEATLNHSEAGCAKALSGRCAALDIGEKRVGVAISDELNISVSPLQPIQRTSWKRLLRDVSDLVHHYDARTLVIGLPLKLDGTEGSAALSVRRLAEKFRLSLDVPVCLHDERLTTYQARENLQSMKYNRNEMERRLDSEAAAIILKDFIASRED